MIILALDPGPEKTGWVLYDSEKRRLLNKGIDLNPLVTVMCTLQQCFRQPFERLVYEMIGHYGSGMAVGKEVFETCVWIGRWEQAFKDEGHVHRLLRKTIAAHLCGSARAKSANIRQALLDRFGGSMRAAKGVKKAPGPLYGVKDHIWSALAVAVTFAERQDDHD